MFCGKCGSEIKEGDLFCPQCGSKVGGQKEAPREYRQPETPSREGYREVRRQPRARREEPILMYCMLGIVIVALIAGIGFGTYQLLKGKDTPEPVQGEEIVEVDEENKPIESSTPTPTDTPVAPMETQRIVNTPIAAPQVTQPPANTPVQVPAATVGDYVFPNSNSTYLTRTEVEMLDLYHMYLARNEIFARRGRTFKNEDLRQYFGSKTWYVGTYSPEEFDANQESIFNEYEKANVKLIGDIEKSLGSPYL